MTVDSPAYRILGQLNAPILIVSDHASNHVPDGIDLGIDPSLLHDHIAQDIGVAGIAAQMVLNGPCCAILGGVSRLVIDYNREPGSPALVPIESDGIAIPGNMDADVDARVRDYFNPYHQMVGQLTGMAHRPFIFSLHSFTPRLRTQPDLARPWDIGVLYNDDDRAVPTAIDMLSARGLVVGDQEPYSGRLLNATMNRHAEAFGRPYLGVEVRQDLIGDLSGQQNFAEALLDVTITLRSLLKD